MLAEDRQHFRANASDCEVNPVAETAEALLDRLQSQPSLTEDLAARVWTVCRYDNYLDEITVKFDSLALLIARETD